MHCGTPDLESFILPCVKSTMFLDLICSMRPRLLIGFRANLKCTDFPSAHSLHTETGYDFVFVLCSPHEVLPFI